MKDKYKSKEQLILEIQQLHHCLCDLEKSKESFKKANRKLKKLAKERDAELTRAKKELNAERKKSKQLGEALQESNEITSALLNTPAEIFTLLNNDGTVLAANQVLAKRLKVPLEDLIGKKVFDWFSQELTELKCCIKIDIESAKSLQYS
jgi:PAS domain-containing protein